LSMADFRIRIEVFPEVPHPVPPCRQSVESGVPPGYNGDKEIAADRNSSPSDGADP
jgi:hypothetical protein